MKARQEFSSHEDYKDYLRHYYAGQAMQGLMAVNDKGLKSWDMAAVEAAKISVMVADELLSKLSN
jgi:hypothetical protein